MKTSMTTGPIFLPESLKVLIDDRESEARREELLVEGLGSGEDIPINPAFWKDLKAEAMYLTKDRRACHS